MPTFQQTSAKYASLWDSAQLRPEKDAEVKDELQKLVALKATYEKVEALTGTPWYVVGFIHYREAGFKMNSHLHNGNPLTARTTDVPAGHPETGTPPFDWVDSAVDALKLKGFHKVKNWTVERIAYQLELYNGWGYRQFGINSPYLWSHTTAYDKGYFIGDHKFSASVANKQAGSLALLKALVAQNLVTVSRQSGVVVPPPPPPVPVPTGLFVADGAAFKLANTPSETATLGFRVTVNMTTRKVKEVDAIWWEIEATDPAGQKHVGFTKKEFLKEQIVMSRFDEDLFAKACLSEARAQGASAHFVIALACAESEMLNVVSEGSSGRFGPLALSEADWTEYNNSAVTGFGDSDRFVAEAQAAVGTALVVRLGSDVKAALPNTRLATSAELYMARVLGVSGLVALLAVQDANAPTAKVREILVPIVLNADLEAIFAKRPSLLTAGITVEQFRKKISDKLQLGFTKAVDLILKVEPDLVLGPSEATDISAAPWMKKARAEIGVTEAASGPRITEYFTATTLGAQPPSVPWCGAFVSWCIKEAGGSTKVRVFSAGAADWLQNGDKLPGPQLGAVAVTKPYSPDDTGHVGFVSSWDGTKVTLLGGNQSDSVCEKSFPIADVRGWRMM